MRVPFAERALTGIVVAVLPGREDDAGPALREIVSVLDTEPVCPPELLDLARRTAARFFASTGEVLKSALPARLPAAGAIRYRITERGALGRASGAEAAILAALSGGESVRAIDLPLAKEGRAEAVRSLEERGWIRTVSAAPERRRRIESAYEATAETPDSDGSVRPSARGRDVLAWLRALGRPATAREARVETGAGPAVLKTLARQGLVRAFEQEARAEEKEAPSARLPGRAAFELTSEQAAAVDAVVAAIRDRRYFPALLQGVTGSGKTEVYLRAIAAALEIGRGAIWLVPEIRRTPVFGRVLGREFGGRASVL